MWGIQGGTQGYIIKKDKMTRDERTLNEGNRRRLKGLLIPSENQNFLAEGGVPVKRIKITWRM